MATTWSRVVHGGSLRLAPEFPLRSFRQVPMEEVWTVHEFWLGTILTNTDQNFTELYSEILDVASSS